jgi:uncharacterized membrane protein YeaQ/YmgE (transglycosylase-associated protein family)
MHGAGYWQVCPSCGRRLEGRRWQHCPFCREALPLPGEPLPPPGMLTTFGVGLCGAVVGGLVGATLTYNALRSPEAPALPTAVVGWVGLAAAAAAAAVAAWLAGHLMRPARRAFERLMIAMLLVTPAAVIVALGWPNPYGLATVFVLGTALIYAHLRRLPPDWGLRPPGAGEDGTPGRRGPS